MKDVDNNHIPAELLSTYRLLECAFPDGVAPDAYFPLLAILEDKMGHRAMASVVALFTGKDYAIALNDVYRVTTTDVPGPDAVARMKERLLPCGYQAWLDEEG